MCTYSTKSNKMKWNLLLNFSYLCLSPILFLQLCSCAGSNSNFQFEVLQANSMHEGSQSFGRFWRNVDCHGKNKFLVNNTDTLSTYSSMVYGKAYVKNGCQKDMLQWQWTMGSNYRHHYNLKLEHRLEGHVWSFKERWESLLWPPITFPIQPQIWNLKW